MSLKRILLLSGIDDGGGTQKSKFASMPSSDKLDKLDRFQRISYEGGSNIDKSETKPEFKFEKQKSLVNDREAGNEYLIWEPKGMKQKLIAFWNNSFEVTYVLSSALIALI